MTLIAGGIVISDMEFYKTGSSDTVVFWVNRHPSTQPYP